MLSRKPKILILYKFLDFPLRTTIDEHLYSFLRYADAHVYYCMLDMGREMAFSQEPVPSYLLKIDFDIILYHYGFMSGRTSRPIVYERALKQVDPFKDHPAIKAILPQDEYFHSKNLAKFVNDFNIDVVFSVSPESEWSKIYDGVDFNKVKFHKVLTGYLDERNQKKINQFLEGTQKDIDVGYRARNLPQWLGRHGYLKTQIAEAFNEALKKFTLNTSISTRPEDTFFGYDWYRFQARCKYMIGVEGGATILDPDGAIHEKGEKYLADHPNCSFEEIEQACFPGLDGKLQLIAISPRHLEACATRTCQLLVESTYNGILKPGVHYIEIKKDLSNIDQVLRLVQDDSKRQEIVENAYRDIVQSGKYTYKSFVDLVIVKCLEEAKSTYFSRKTSNNFVVEKYNHAADRLAHRQYVYWQKYHRKITNKWTYIIFMIDVIKFMRLKAPIKKIYQLFKKKELHTVK